MEVWRWLEHLRKRGRLDLLLGRGRPLERTLRILELVIDALTKWGGFLARVGLRAPVFAGIKVRLFMPMMSSFLGPVFFNADHRLIDTEFGLLTTRTDLNLLLHAAHNL